MEPLTRTFAALSDETRLAIVEALLQHGELPAGALVRGTDISAPAVSRHLKVLRVAGVIRQRVDGTHRFYSVEPAALRAVAEWTLDRRQFWEASLDRLESFLETDSEVDPDGRP